MGLKAVEDAGALSTYLDDIGRHPLLSHDQTIALFVQMRSPTTRERDRAAIMRRLVEANLRLVVSIARPYAGKGVPLLDLIQEGNCGLMEGIRRFDPARGFRLSTYAGYWIRQAIYRHLSGTDQLAGSRQVRLPAHVVAMLPRIAAARADIERDAGGDVEASPEAIAAHMGASPELVSAAVNASGGVHSVDVLTSPPGGPHQDGGGARPAGRWGRAVERAMSGSDSGLDDMDDVVMAKQLRGLVRGAVGRLTPREEQVIRLRFALVEDASTDPSLAMSQEELDSLVGRGGDDE
jgi:RNA polymerase primary sigma factor